MIIAEINSIYLKNHFLKPKYKNTSDKNLISKCINITYPKNYYINFKGGKSLDLKQTIDILHSKSKIPPKVYEKANEIINQGNPDDLTLLDIHKVVYKGLLDCKTLDEAKKLYPEFKDVKSDSEVKTNMSSLIWRAKHGLISAFNPCDDISLELIKMYWGQGFSTLHIEKIIGFNPCQTLKKLNIPKADNLYGKYLKLSDKEYNEHFSLNISKQIKGYKKYHK